MDIVELKKKYQAIEVPTELKGRLEFVMKQAEKSTEVSEVKTLTNRGFARTSANIGDRNEVHKVRRFRASTVAKFAGMAAAFVLVFTAVLANASATTSYAVGRIPVLGPIAKVMTFRSFEDQTNDMSATVETPVITDEQGNTDGKAAEANAELKAYTDKVIEDYKALVAETSGQAKASVEVSSETVTDTDKLLILELSTTETAADSGTFVKTYAIEKVTGNIINLSDMFAAGTDYQTLLTAEIQRQMREKMAADPDNTVYFLDSDMPEYDFTSLAADQSFYINTDGNLVIVFDEGQVAPMYMGVQEFEIPQEVMAGVGNPAYFGM
ncbi:MAG: RsiV family protein [Lachnospiraceae bacterium]|nr:RsiV family protein [Lachnospiraceae bacterium]